MTTLDSIKKMTETGCKGFTCDECPVAEFCSVMSHTGETGSTLAEALLNFLSYDSDLSKCEVGDWVWDQRHASWRQITGIDYSNRKNAYPILVEGKLHYTADGKHWDDHKLPVLFVKPPLCFNPGTKPDGGLKYDCEFKDGDKVLVKNWESGDWKKAYFCKLNQSDNCKYVTYADGKDAWTSDGETVCWRYCKKAEE